MKIAVDVGSLATPGNGIARYLRALLPELWRESGTGHRWLLYGRTRPSTSVLGRVAGVETMSRSDRMPATLGRVAALGTSLPAWLLLDRPELFWGPAHRLPLYLPRQTARVVTVHDLCWRRQPDSMQATTRFLDTALMPRALRQADRIIAVSHATRTELLNWRPELADKVRVVHEAASELPDPEPVEHLARWQVRPPYVLFVGTQEPRKNLPRLLQAWRRIAPSTPGILVVAGATGWGNIDLARLVAAANLEQRVRILGAVDDRDLATLYRHACCLGLPSLYEGFGLPLVEAMAMGTPVLTSNVASMPEVAGDAGILVNPHDVDAIANGLQRMLLEPGLRAALAARAPTQAARFSWQRAARETMAVLAEARKARIEAVRP